MKKIICAQSLLNAKEIFSTIGNVEIIDDHLITHHHLQDAHALIVRSQTQVNANLLKDSTIEFVGTATSGTEHLDLNYLEKKQIAYADAKGVNANAVAEHVLQSILIWANAQQRQLQDLTIGIIGYGFVGKRLHQQLKPFVKCILINDPPLFSIDKSFNHVTLQTITQQADVVSVHVPLIYGTTYPTYHLLNQPFFTQCQKKPLIVNVARGDVVDYDALLHALSQQSISDFIADVWPKEPYINPAFINAAFLATPHIAGHSQYAKIMGTYVIYKALTAYWQCEKVLTTDELKKMIRKIKLSQVYQEENLQKQLMHLLAQLYPLQKISQSMKLNLQQPEHFVQNYQILRQQAAQRCELNQVLLPAQAISVKLHLMHLDREY
ncbi:MAG: erythronate-4-phosphate dehydrogenase [Legionellales bacterium]|nr:erythronate-4-phosphate dehydrogenase [Legionellales bacterium]|tara:strand:- start:965 stop:2104 length:1140 start_codon:yes stop_codon:yes gene_type:complete